MKRLSGKNSNHVKQVCKILAEGKVGALPTETVYGLGADALNPRAVGKIFEVKRRPVFDPLIVHVKDIKQVDLICQNIPTKSKQLMKKFWPGPLTIILQKKEIVPDLVTAGLNTVAVRMPSHPVALQVLKSFNRPIAAPSANVFGKVSPTDAHSVEQELGDRIDFVLNGGSCNVGVESTIVKQEKNKLLVLRPGGISTEDLKRSKLYEVVAQTRKGPIEGPGMLDSHYATNTPLFYFERGSIRQQTEELEKIKKLYVRKKKKFPSLIQISFKQPQASSVFKKQLFLSRSGDVEEAANRLFKVMREADGYRSRGIFMMGSVPKRGLGMAINDRLKKASINENPFVLLRKNLK